MLIPRWRWGILAGALSVASLPCGAQWTIQESAAKARLRGLSVVGPEVAWASGSEGTVIRTTNGGTQWRTVVVPDAKALDFRDIHAVDARTAYLLAIGEGEKSRILKTTDGGASWLVQFVNPDPNGFLDAIAFWDADHGIALGDPVDGRYTVLTTADGGAHWTKGTAEGMPPALAGEGAFAASGTCLTTFGDKEAWFGTGGGATARVFRTRDRGATWTAHETPIRAGSATSGIFSLAFRDADHGVIVGGTYDRPDLGGRVAATTEDGGATWSIVARDEPKGFRSAVAFLGGDDPQRVVAVGPTGSDASTDGGRTWAPIDGEGYHAVGFVGPGAGWAVGEAGRVAKFSGR